MIKFKEFNWVNGRVDNQLTAFLAEGNRRYVDVKYQTCRSDVASSALLIYKEED